MLETRDMLPEDVPACVRIINHIIAQGGTTAHEDRFTEDLFEGQYRLGPPVRSVVLSEGRVVGFQVAFLDTPGHYSIGSFTDRENPVKGAGYALFEKTLSDCRKRGGDAILAKITSDNTGGLIFYDRLGFVDDHVIEKDHMRPDGTRVDRIVKRFAL
ncbi:GNAT family N-acetyltransferase [Pacificoceanicola onchidii]|uniref:GNAT family N-acetyltransferase n=1 Tax=Pacificoceanicola onchidii TaxID=2562685 RepID=UPI0010A614FB|nr:GNAT family N-acetyltransferase [Pacificoceanicola onchidii]